MLWLCNTMNWIDVTLDAIRKNLSIENVIYFLIQIACTQIEKLPYYHANFYPAKDGNDIAN